MENLFLLRLKIFFLLHGDNKGSTLGFHAQACRNDTRCCSINNP